MDLDIRLDHLTTVAVRPHRDDSGKWWARVDLRRGSVVDVIPDCYRVPEDSGPAVRGPGETELANAVKEST